MSTPSPSELPAALAALAPRDPGYATRFVDLLLPAACAAGASDVHLQPTPAGLELRWRIDGVLEPLGVFPRGEATDVIARLKVLARLLTYSAEAPQEGRLTAPVDGVEMRVSTFPTLHGERAVVRLFQAPAKLLCLADLGLPHEALAGLSAALDAREGLVVIAGPAGSGKTTTAYALLRELAHRSAGQRSLMSLEDPIEAALPGVSQTQVDGGGPLSMAAALRSLLRQDPEVILVGEIRDRDTAAAALAAALTGHLVVSTLHAGSAAGVISRLAEMDLEPYLLRSGLRMVVCQRLLRKLCACRAPLDDPDQRLGLDTPQAWRPVGCAQCRGSGYRGRFALAEQLTLDDGPVAQAILARADAVQLAALARAAGRSPLFDQALAAVAAGQTSPAEVRRVFGWGGERSQPL